MEKGKATKPVRKISRSYSMAIRYELLCKPLTDDEIIDAIRKAGAGRGITGVGLKQNG